MQDWMGDGGGEGIASLGPGPLCQRPDTTSGSQLLQPTTWRSPAPEALSVSEGQSPCFLMPRGHCCPLLWATSPCPEVWIPCIAYVCVRVAIG